MSYVLPDLRYQKRATDPKVILKNLKKDYRFKTSVGIWYFTPGGGRFHDRYVPEASIEARLEMAAGMAKLGVTGIEAHYPKEINFDNAHLYKRLQKEAGIAVAAVPFSHFYEKVFEFGSLSNPEPASRRRAKEIAVEGLRLVKELGAVCAISWPGIDGYRYMHGKPFMHMWELFETTLAEAMDEVPGVMGAIEPKPYEPAPNNIYRNTAEGLLAARRIEAKLKNSENLKILRSGKVLVGMNPEVGHVKMGFEILPAAYSLCGLEGRLAHTHWNSQPDGNYDQDNDIGVVNPYEAEALLYALWGMGYDGYFGIDILPENIPVRTCVEINMRALERLREKVRKLPHEDIMECHLHPERNRGRLERILVDHW
ncbi:MAG: xylose isomerase [Elusimicrobia bacterium]|nr:xylose isomerase [Elusimicrobiota bacterium]